MYWYSFLKPQGGFLMENQAFFWGGHAFTVLFFAGGRKKSMKYVVIIIRRRHPWKDWQKGQWTKKHIKNQEHTKSHKRTCYMFNSLTPPPNVIVKGIGDIFFKKNFKIT